VLLPRRIRTRLPRRDPGDRGDTDIDETTSPGRGVTKLAADEEEEGETEGGEGEGEDEKN
jgi:hypothetical protein